MITVMPPVRPLMIMIAAVASIACSESSGRQSGGIALAASAGRPPGEGWAMTGRACAGTDTTGVPPLVSGSDTGRFPPLTAGIDTTLFPPLVARVGLGNPDGRGDDEFRGLVDSVPGGFAGIFYELDPPPPVNRPPAPESRRIVVLLADTTQKEAALRELAPTIAEKRPGWQVQPQVQRARWTFRQLRAWHRYLRWNPEIRQAAAFTFIDARRNRLHFGVWDAAGRARLEARLAEVDLPCFLVWIEVGTEIGVDDRGLVPVEAREISFPAPGDTAPVTIFYDSLGFDGSCRPPLAELPAGRRVYDIRVRSWARDKRDPMAETIRAVERLGGRMVHRFNVGILRAELTPAQARFLMRRDSSLVWAAHPVPDPKNMRIQVQILFDGRSTEADSVAIAPFAHGRMRGMRRRALTIMVDDADIPRIAALSRVRSVQGYSWGCGIAGA